MSNFQTFIFSFLERLAPPVGGVWVHKGTASYPISQDNEAQVIDVRCPVHPSICLSVCKILSDFMDSVETVSLPVCPSVTIYLPRQPMNP